MVAEKIPFNRPTVAGSELRYIEEAVANGRISGDGQFTSRCAKFFEQRFSVGKILMTPSCTGALEMAALLLDLGPGDEVIMPSFTFVSTANAVVRTGARPVFADIDPATGNVCPQSISSRLGNNTKAVFVVHYAGVACDMDEIQAIADTAAITVVEDAAQGVNSFYKDRALGSLGDLSAYSFHETKNFTCGEGGALGINRASLQSRAEIIRDKGTNRQAFFRGEIDKYTWMDVGSSFVLGELSAAFLWGQLEAMDTLQSSRDAIYHRYQRWLEPVEASGSLRRPVVPEDCRSNHHLYSIQLNDTETRNRLMDFLRQQNIQAVFHYVPLHSSPMGSSLGYAQGDLPQTERFSACQLRLPYFYDLTLGQQRRVVEAIGDFFGVSLPPDNTSDLDKSP